MLKLQGKTGEKRFQGILDRFGIDLVKSARDEIFRQSEELEREGKSYKEWYLLR